jgi:activating signal cointegrator 1
MKVLTIIQPWATLVALGEKKFETRSWSTTHRGELAIHSSKRIDKLACRQEPIRSVLEKHGYSERNLPIGVILATCTLSDCFKVIANTGTSATLDDGNCVTGAEYFFGDFSEGRYAWEITKPEILPEIIPAKGRLGLWEHSLAMPF